MTENEAKTLLAQVKENTLILKEVSTGIEMLEKNIYITKAELEQYRAIGTVEDIEKSMQNVSVLLAEHELLKLYQSIGTVEEFKALKEKSTPKELAEHNFQDELHHYLCPSCRSIVSHNQNYCEECGQSLET